MTNYLDKITDGGPTYWYGWKFATSDHGFRDGGGPYFTDYYGKPFTTQAAAQKESERNADDWNASRAANTPKMVPTWGVVFVGPEDKNAPPTLFDSRWDRPDGEWKWTLNSSL